MTRHERMKLWTAGFIAAHSGDGIDESKPEPWQRGYEAGYTNRREKNRLLDEYLVSIGAAPQAVIRPAGAGNSVVYQDRVAKLPYGGGINGMNISRRDAEVIAFDADQEIEKLKLRCRTAAQLLIEEIRASGPENVEEAAKRAVAKIRELKKEIDRLCAD